MTLSIDPDKSRAILIGASKFPEDPENIPELPAVRNNVKDLKRLITNPDIIGIPPENVRTLLDELYPSDVARQLAREARKASDTLIIYYAGHGMIGRWPPKFYLAVGSTIDDDVDYTALEFDKVRSAINESGATKKILVLDSCFSGRALDFMGQKTSLMQSNLDIKGTYAIASAPGNQPAIAPEGAQYTAFTGELLHVLKEGLEIEKETLSLKDIYEHIRAQFRSRPGLPEPQQAHIQDAVDIQVARNRKFREHAAELPSELQDALASIKFFERVGAVYELKSLLNCSDKPMALAAYEALLRLQEDDSRRISELAKKILQTDKKPESPPQPKRGKPRKVGRVKPLETFRDTLKDGSKSPEMVVIPAGTFRMGNIQEKGLEDEKPVHEVTLDAFAIGRNPLTVGESRRFVEATGYQTEAEQQGGAYVYDGKEWGWKSDASWRNPYMQQDEDHPVVCTSWCVGSP